MARKKGGKKTYTRKQAQMRLEYAELLKPMHRCTPSSKEREKTDAGLNR